MALGTQHFQLVDWWEILSAVMPMLGIEKKWVLLFVISEFKLAKSGIRIGDGHRIKKSCNKVSLLCDNRKDPSCLSI